MKNKINRDKVVFINLTEMDKYNGLEENTHGGGLMSTKTGMDTSYSTSASTQKKMLWIHANLPENESKSHIGISQARR